MTKGYFQLSYSGKKDLKLISNPKISFWKYVYKQHTNFSIQNINIEDTTNEHRRGSNAYMTQCNKSSYVFRIPRNADLVDYMSLKLTLPAVYSVDGFAWIKNVGAMMIKSAKLFFDQTLIEEIDGDFLLTHQSLLMKSDEKKIFDRLIGNIPELYNPYQYYKYKKSTIGSNMLPSIPKYTLNVPLLFCFFREKSFIPLIANQLCEVYVEIELRPLKELYTIVENNEQILFNPAFPLTELFIDSSGVTINDASGSMAKSDVRPLSTNFTNYPVEKINIKRRKINNTLFTNYIKDDAYLLTCISGKLQRITNSQESKIKPTLDVSFVFLDNNERNTMAKYSLKQIFSFVRRVEYNNFLGKKKIYLNRYHPMQSIRVIARRNDVHERNQWSNYTNLDHTEQDPLYLQNNYLRLSKIESDTGTKPNIYKLLGSFTRNIDTRPGATTGSTIVSEPQFGNGTSPNPLTMPLGIPIKILKKPDCITGDPIFTHKHKVLDASYILKMLYSVVVKQGQNYVRIPKVYDQYDNEIPATIELEDRRIKSIDIQGDYNTYLRFRLQTPSFVDKIYIDHPGSNYSSNPNIYAIYNKSEIISYVNIGQALCYDNKIKSYSKTSIGHECNPELYKTQITIGGELHAIMPLETNFGTKIPSYQFVTRKKNIVLPELEYKNGIMQIKTKGCGLIDDLSLRMGKILESITIKNGGNFYKNIHSCELVPIHYPNNLPINSDKMNNIINPRFQVYASRLNHESIKYNIELQDYIEVNGENVSYPNFTELSFTEIANNSCLLRYRTFENTSKFNSVATNILPMFMVVHSGVPIAVPLGYYNSAEFLPLNISIILNLKTNVTEYFNNISIKHFSSIEKKLSTFALSTNKFKKIFKTNDIVSLYFNNIEIDTITIKNINGISFGASDNYLPNWEDINNNNNNLLFGGLDVDEPIHLEAGKKVKNIVPIYDRYDSGLPVKIEYDYGGSTDCLQDSLHFETIDGKLIGVSFNKTAGIWDNFSKSPLFICKKKNLYLMDDNRQKKSEDLSQDALIRGVIDGGGSGFKGALLLDKGGFGGEMLIEKQDGDIFDIRCISSGYNYHENLKCTLVSYYENNGKLTYPKLIDQFDLKINDFGQIDDSEYILWKNGKGYNRISFFHSSNDIYQFENKEHNMLLDYVLIVGGIPDESVIISEEGNEYNLPGNFELDISFSKNFYQGDSLFVEKKHFRKTIIKEGKVTQVSIEIPKINNFNVPLVRFTKVNEHWRFVPIECECNTTRKLTGFEIISPGEGFADRDEICVYNRFITDFIVDKTKIFLEPPKININRKNTDESFKIKTTLDKRGCIDNVFFPENQKISFRSNRVFCELDDYLNIRRSNIVTNDIPLLDEMNTMFLDLEELKKKNDKPPRIDSLDQEAYQFHSLSELVFGETIDRIEVLDTGNELDDEYSNYRLLFRDIHKQIIIPHELEYLLHFKGANGDKKGNIYDIKVVGDGGGDGASAHCDLIKGEGAEIMGVMRLEELTLNDMDYMDDPAINLGFSIDNAVLNLYDANANVHQWSSIKNSYEIEMQNMLDKDMIRNLVDNWQYRDPTNVPIIDSNKKKDFYSKGILKGLGVRINNEVREEFRDIEYYKSTEKYFTMNCANDSEIAVYSFCLDNNNLQPTGSCDMFKVDNVILDLEAKTPYEVGEGYKYDIILFFKEYNIIEYVNGKGAVKYGN